MKTLKKLTVLLLALGLTAGFAACGGNGGDGSEGGSESAAGSATSEQVGIVGEDVTEAEFNEAIQATYDATNFTLVGKTSESVEGTETSYTAKCANGKIYTVAEITTNGVTKTEYSYVGQVDGVYYIWTSIDNQTWDRYEYTVEEGVDPASGEAAVGEIFYWCGNFQYHAFDASTGMHEFNPFGGPTIMAMVSNGKIVKYRCEESQNDWSEGEITYGNATVGELPSVTE